MPRRLGWGEHIYVEYLKLDRRRAQHVVFCPFHPDSGTPSFSVDLGKVQHYCHGACDEPKGGGVVGFLLKWARLVEGKPITKDEARKRVNSIGRIPSAQEVAREFAAADARLFANATLSAQAQRALAIERLARDFMQEFRTEAEAGNATVWKTYDYLLRIVRMYDDVLEISVRSRKIVTAPLVAVVKAARERGWWTDAMHDAWQTRLDFLRDINARLRDLDQDQQEGQETPCDSPSTTTPPDPDPIPKKPRRTSVPESLLRQI